MKLHTIALLLLSTLINACTPDGVKNTSQNDENQTQTGGINSDGTGTGSALSTAQKNVSYQRNAINDQHSVLAERIIYFDFDSKQISQDFMDLLAHHGKYLAANPDVKLRLEGHGDERGTREYNVALGNHRAQAVRRLMMFQGADASQFTVVSYGEEKPASFGHDQDSWRLNRRTELVYR